MLEVLGEGNAVVCDCIANVNKDEKGGVRVKLAHDEPLLRKSRRETWRPCRDSAISR